MSFLVFISDNLNWSLHINKKIVSEYDHEIPQSQTADKPMAPRDICNLVNSTHDFTRRFFDIYT